MRPVILLLLILLVLSSCWKNRNRWDDANLSRSRQKVMGYKPVYGPEPEAKKVLYSAGAKPVVGKGNIYAFQNYIFQIDPGWGIHVIDSKVPSAAARIGFIQVKGCSQISIKNDKLYTNSYDDLVVLDFADLNNIQEVSRLKGVFIEYRYGSHIAQPPSAGYYECPSLNGFVTGWVRDSIFQTCYKN